MSPYVGAKLAEMFDPDVTDHAAHEITFRVGDELHDKAALFTPIETGNLKTAWYAEHVRPVMLVGNGGYVVVVKNDTSYVEDVEEGTGLYGPSGSKYPIEAKPGKMLSWVTTKPFFSLREQRVIPAGTRMFAKRVMHPGSRGHHMMKRALAYTDLTWRITAREVLDEFWVREMELAILRAQVPLA